MMAPKANGCPTYLLPAEFDAEGIVGPLKADAARWLVSNVLRKLTVHDVDARGFAILSSTVLERAMGHGYARIVRDLLKANVLKRSPYREGRSYGYRLSDAYLAGKPRRMPVTNPVMRDRLERERKRYNDEQAKRWLPIHDRLNESQQGLTVLPAVHDVVDRLPAKSRICQRVHVDRLERGELPLTISSTQRLFNGLSGVKSDLREFVRLDGSRLGCIDISNSQPALLATLLTNGFPREWGKRCSSIKVPFRIRPVPPSSVVLCLAAAGSASCFARFRSVACAGLLYDVLAESFNGNRQWVKDRFPAAVLAKKGSFQSPVEDEFRRLFPDAWEAIRMINAHDHANLIRILQSCEAWLVLERIAARLVGRIPVVTLHDAVYSTRGDVSVVRGAFDDVFDELGIRLALKAE